MKRVYSILKWGLIAYTFILTFFAVSFLRNSHVLQIDCTNKVKDSIKEFIRSVQTSDFDTLSGKELFKNKGRFNEIKADFAAPCEFISHVGHWDDSSAKYGSTWIVLFKNQKHYLLEVENLNKEDGHFFKSIKNICREAKYKVMKIE